MPFIHIKSLPFNPEKDTAKIVKSIGHDFAATNNIALHHVHVTWEYFNAGHYARAGNAPEHHPASQHPLIVELLTPNLNSPDTIESMLDSLAKSISARAGVDIHNIFINHRHALSGNVFDEGKVIKW